VGLLFFPDQIAFPRFCVVKTFLPAAFPCFRRAYFTKKTHVAGGGDAIALFGGDHFVGLDHVRAPFHADVVPEQNLLPFLKKLHAAAFDGGFHRGRAHRKENERHNEQAISFHRHL
jgi:hypothetical protein